MTLGQKQRLFVQLTGLLIQWAYENGYELTTGDGYRDPRAFGEQGERHPFNLDVYGRKLSAHKNKLAHDWNLFIDGEYQTTTAAHGPLGAYWESLHADCVWGGHFDDGNHYSMNHNGVK